MSKFYTPGRVIAINIGAGLEHYAIISGLSKNGMLMVISLRAATNQIREEAWQLVVGTSHWRFADEYEGRYPPQTILHNARALIGKVGYNLFQWNCEHFVSWCAGYGVNSKQVRVALSLACAALGIYALAKVSKS